MYNIHYQKTLHRMDLVFIVLGHSHEGFHLILDGEHRRLWLFLLEVIVVHKYQRHAVVRHHQCNLCPDAWHRSHEFWLHPKGSKLILPLKDVLVQNGYLDGLLLTFLRYQKDASVVLLVAIGHKNTSFRSRWIKLAHLLFHVAPVRLHAEDVLVVGRRRIDVIDVDTYQVERISPVVYVNFHFVPVRGIDLKVTIPKSDLTSRIKKPIDSQGIRQGELKVLTRVVLTCVGIFYELQRKLAPVVCCE
mmetsp:Transcript_12283/g.23136  ORF Transcript_12283/g.23136 Transcript_12283/m.23136 type:complete len:246 (-) Transcript_12283:615-1352(-)